MLTKADLKKYRGRANSIAPIAPVAVARSAPRAGARTLWVCSEATLASPWSMIAAYPGNTDRIFRVENSASETNESVNARIVVIAWIV